MIRTLVNLCATIFAIGLMSALSGCALPPDTTAVDYVPVAIQD